MAGSGHVAIDGDSLTTKSERRTKRPVHGLSARVGRQVHSLGFRIVYVLLKSRLPPHMAFEENLPGDYCQVGKRLRNLGYFTGGAPFRVARRTHDYSSSHPKGLAFPKRTDLNELLSVQGPAPIGQPTNK